jgi:hypothetical protein
MHAAAAAVASLNRGTESLVVAHLADWRVHVGLAGDTARLEAQLGPQRVLWARPTLEGVADRPCRVVRMAVCAGPVEVVQSADNALRDKCVVPLPLLTSRTSPLGRVSLCTHPRYGGVHGLQRRRPPFP